MNHIQTVHGELSANFKGEIILPGEPGYDESRAIWNGMIDRHPAIIVLPKTEQDIIEAVKAARKYNLELAIKGGGHNVAGTAICDDGLMIDMSLMKEVVVNPEKRVAVVQPGALNFDLDEATQVHNLATTAGVISHTGVAGLTLGGGIGWLMRKHGLTVDNLISVDLVTAEGIKLHVSEHENPELFWGVRGGGGNFGVVTKFEFRLHPLGPQIMTGVIMYPAEQAKEVLIFYRDFIVDSPDELGTILNLRHAPAAPWIPEEHHGKPVVLISVLYAGSLEEGAKVLQPLKDFGQPLIDTIGPGTYIEQQTRFDKSVPHGLRYYWKSVYTPPFTDELIDTLIDKGWTSSSPASYTIIFHLGGAITKIAVDATATSGRDATHAININSVWTNPSDDEKHKQWAQNFFDAVQPFSSGSVYLNFLGQEGEARVKDAYGAEAHRQLVALKKQYDPTNFFHLNQNIKPE